MLGIYYVGTGTDWYHDASFISGRSPRGSLQCICEYQRFAMDTLIPYQIVCVFCFFWYLISRHCWLLFFFGTLLQDIVKRLLRDVLYVSAGVPCSDVLDPYRCWVTNQPSQSTIVLQKSNPSAKKNTETLALH